MVPCLGVAFKPICLHKSINEQVNQGWCANLNSAYSNTKPILVFTLVVNKHFECAECANHFSCVRVFATLWTIDCQPPLFMGFSRREYWSGLPFPSPGHLPHPGIELTCLKSPALADRFFTTGATWDLGLIWWKRLLNTHKLFPPHTKPSSIYNLHLKQ